MKVPVIGAIGLAVGLAGGTGIGMRGGNAPAPVDSTKVHADSTAAKPDSLTASHDSATIEKPAVLDTSSTKPAAPPAAAPTAAATDKAFDAKAIADAMAKLEPADVASLLGRFNDDEVMSTLKLMSMTRASSVVAKMPEPRGGKLGRRLLLELGTGAKK